MTGYKDRTWCTRYSTGECKNSSCIFALTLREKEMATHWWGSEHFPVSIGDRMDGGCGYVTE